MAQSNPIKDLFKPETFIEVFKQAYSEHKSDILPLTRRNEELTSFYKNILFKKIVDIYNASKLSTIKTEKKLYQYEKEFLRIDIVLGMGGKKNDYPVPMISVESENDLHGNIENEVKKLLSVNSYLKVLLTKTDNLADITETKFLGKEDTYWRYLIEDFMDYGLMNSQLIVIILNVNDGTYLYKIYGNSEKDSLSGNFATIN